MRGKSKPTVSTIDVDGGRLRLYFSFYKGDVFLPSIAVTMKQDVAEPLAQRAGIECIQLASGINLYPAKWLAAVKPDRADDLKKLKASLLANAAHDHGPNQ